MILKDYIESPNPFISFEQLQKAQSKIQLNQIWKLT